MGYAGAAGYAGGGDCCAAVCRGAGCAGTGCGDGNATSTMSFVGNGAGDYVQQTTYRYIGGGAGEFAAISVPATSGRLCCLITISLLLLLPLLLLLLQPSTTITTTAPEPPPLPTTTASCSGDESTWSISQRLRCCNTVGKGCPHPRPHPQPHPLPSTTKCPFDCNAGYNDLGPTQWVKGWSGAKKIYCCKTANRGCPSQLPPPSGLPQDDIPGEPDTFQYDCNAGYHHCAGCLKKQWSPNKIRYCCTNEHKGCSAMK